MRRPKYTVTHNAELASNAALICLEGVTAVRPFVYYGSIGPAPDGPSDRILRAGIYRVSALRSGGTSLTPVKLDPLTAASQMASRCFGGPFSGEPTLADPLVLFPFGRACVSWECSPLHGITHVLSASLGSLVLACTTLAGSAPNVSGVLTWWEEFSSGIV